MATAKSAGPARGSEKISDSMFEQPSEISKADLRSLIKITRQNGVNLTGWWIYGKPAIDAVHGVLQVKPELAGGIVKDLVMLDKARLRLDVFPLGIINPELVEIRFRTPGAGR